MAPRMGRMSKPKNPAKPKKVPFRLITKEDHRFAGMHRILSGLVSDHHPHLKNARIALAWHSGWKADTDGRMKLGMCKLASDFDRQLHDFDFVIVLNRSFWTSMEVTDAQRKALLDHELCHAEVSIDPATNDPKETELGRTIYRIRRHDIEEFSAIVERHGLYKKDLEHFAAAIARGPMLPLEGDTAAAKPEEQKARRQGRQSKDIAAADAAQTH